MKLQINLTIKPKIFKRYVLISTQTKLSFCAVPMKFENVADSALIYSDREIYS